MYRRVTFGMFLRGDLTSPAVVMSSSGANTNAKPALHMARQTARNLPVSPGTRYSFMAPGLFQYSNPSTPWELGAPPQKITADVMRRTKMARN